MRHVGVRHRYTGNLGVMQGPAFLSGGQRVARVRWLKGHRDARMPYELRLVRLSLVATVIGGLVTIRERFAEWRKRRAK